MNQRPIMDAGPGINFFSLNKERLLFDTLGSVSVPETVRDEILRKARQDLRFQASARVLGKLPERLFEVLSDDITPELEKVITRISQVPMSQRLQRSKDLGETMVVAHAVVAAESGKEVFVLIDDQGGKQLAATEAERLVRFQRAGRAVGRLNIITTVTILKEAAGSIYIPTAVDMRKLYEKLRTLDDGLVPIEQTGLLTLPCWKSRP